MEQPGNAAIKACKQGLAWELALHLVCLWVAVVVPARGMSKPGVPMARCFLMVAEDRMVYQIVMSSREFDTIIASEHDKRDGRGSLVVDIVPMFQQNPTTFLLLFGC